MTNASFQWDDPFLLDQQLQPEERAVHALIPGRAQTGLQAFAA